MGLKLGRKKNKKASGLISSYAWDMYKTDCVIKSGI